MLLPLLCLLALAPLQGHAATMRFLISESYDGTVSHAIELGGDDSVDRLVLHADDDLDFDFPTLAKLLDPATESGVTPAALLDALTLAAFFPEADFLVLGTLSALASEAHELNSIDTVSVEEWVMPSPAELAVHETYEEALALNLLREELLLAMATLGLLIQEKRSEEEEDAVKEKEAKMIKMMMETATGEKKDMTVICAMMKLHPRLARVNPAILRRCNANKVSLLSIILSFSLRLVN